MIFLSNMEPNEYDLEEIAKKVKEGYTSGREDDPESNTSISWEIKIEKWCTLCNGTGEISEDVRNSDGHWERGVGSRKCICQIKEDDDSN